MEPIPAPGVVAQDDIGADGANRPCDLPLGPGAIAELAVGPAEEFDLAPAQDDGGAALFVLAQGDEGCLVAFGVPRTLGAVGQDQVVDGGAGGRPLGQRSTAAELDVIGMRPDGQGDGRDGEVAGDGAAGRQIVDRVGPRRPGRGRS